MTTTSEKPRAFFAHSTHSFDTDTETRILKLLRGKYRVLCPNNDIGRLEQFKKYLNIVGWSDLVVVLEHEGYITMGLYSEVLHALKLGIPVWVIRESPDGYVFERVERIEYQPIRENRNQYGKLIIQDSGSTLH
ncbi:MAG: hypothetical protein D4R64_05015 [Porphyromonadaceae bacterium]|nr:MAG: hypothetical protein D4R64_05015 [Porphyromonadaceae bacterium]